MGSTYCFTPMDKILLKFRWFCMEFWFLRYEVVSHFPPNANKAEWIHLDYVLDLFVTILEQFCLCGLIRST